MSPQPLTCAPGLIDPHGRPLSAPSPAKTRAFTGGPSQRYPYGQSAFPYQAASWISPEMGDWQPQIRSPDSEINQFRDRMVARQRDLVRNDGMASGGIAKILDNTVGSRFRWRSTPDYRALAHATGIKGFDAVWANEYRQQAESRWRSYAEDVGRYSDVSRQLPLAEQLRLALRHKLIDGDSLMVAYSLPERVGRGRARYATAWKLVDPDRISNPYQAPDTRYLRGGVEIDDDDVPVAIHVRKAQPGDWYAGVDQMTWERIAIEDDDGWRRVVHDFDHDRANQHRGVGVFAPVLARLKMLATYYGLELQQAALQASLGTYLTSPYDPAQVMEAVGQDSDELSAYQQLRLDWSKERPALFNGVNVAGLAPGEDIKTVSASHPHEGFEAFAHEMQAGSASALGITLEQFNQRWNEMNYSNARGSFMDTWKTLIRRRHQFETGTANPVVATWMHEPFENGELPLPAGAPDYVEYRTEFSRGMWLGPARGWMDPVKEPQGAVLEMDAGLTTLQEVGGVQGFDYEERLDQRAIEVQAFKDRGLTVPSWAAMNVPANQAAQPADPEEKELAQPE
jgi:lambda family phage portal protein